MIREVWERRMAERRKREQERLDKLSAIERARLARGKMPHWSTYEKRLDANGEPMRGVMSHIARPQHLMPSGDVNNPPTCCGWHMASFRSARAFGLPRHDVVAGQNNVQAFITQGYQTSCPICYDVVNDIATWVEIARGNAARDECFHLAWEHIDLKRACGRVGTGMVYSEYADALANGRTLEPCSLCTAIFQRLFGINRPENEFSIYTTNEEAAVANGFGIKR